MRNQALFQILIEISLTFYSTIQGCINVRHWTLADKKFFMSDMTTIISETFLLYECCQERF